MVRSVFKSGFAMSKKRSVSSKPRPGQSRSRRVKAPVKRVSVARTALPSADNEGGLVSQRTRLSASPVGTARRLASAPKLSLHREEAVSRMPPVLSRPLAAAPLPAVRKAEGDGSRNSASSQTRDRTRLPTKNERVPTESERAAAMARFEARRAARQAALAAETGKDAVGGETDDRPTPEATARPEPPAAPREDDEVHAAPSTVEHSEGENPTNLADDPERGAERIKGSDEEIDPGENADPESAGPERDEGSRSETFAPYSDGEGPAPEADAFPVEAQDMAREQSPDTAPSDAIAPLQDGADAAAAMRSDIAMHSGEEASGGKDAPGDETVRKTRFVDPLFTPRIGAPSPTQAVAPEHERSVGPSSGTEMANDEDTSLYPTESHVEPSEEASEERDESRTEETDAIPTEKPLKDESGSEPSPIGTQSSKLLAIADRLARPIRRGKTSDTPASGGDTPSPSSVSSGDAASSEDETPVGNIAPAMPPAAHLVVPEDGAEALRAEAGDASSRDDQPAAQAEVGGHRRDTAPSARRSKRGRAVSKRNENTKGTKRRRTNAGLVLGGTLLAASLAVAGVILFQPTVDYRARTACGTPEPVVTLATQSKYDQSDVRKASLGDGARPRELVLEPLRRTVLSIADGAVAGGEARHCARVSLVAWAQNDALTDMRTKDAHLTRSRLVAEMALAAVALDEANALSPRERRIVARWGERVARDTVRFFANGAGPTSRRNNHRYWAALAVGAVGAFADRPELAAWARESAGIGLCSVDERGLLPLELGRGERALHYHLYALRPLAALKRLDRSVDGLEMACVEALPRLARATRAMLVDPSRMEAITGVAQLSPPRESAYGPLLRLDRAALNRLSAPALRGTIARFDDMGEKD